MILVYRDEGVSEVSALGLHQAFSAFQEVRFTSGALLQKKEALKDVKILVIPGGRSLPYYTSLGEKGNQAIIDFVRQGGVYLGVCAGAYYAAKQTFFAQGTPNALTLDGPLCFFPGDAVGPVFQADQFGYQSEAGAVITSVFWGQKDYQSYFNGGCYFKASNPDYILATYAENGLPAIVSFPYHQGHVVLSGVHPELEAKAIPEDNKVLQRALQQADMSRRELLEKLCQECYAHPRV